VSIQTNGAIPSEFDPTTNSLLQTIMFFGVSEDELRADQDFLVDVMLMIGSTDPRTTTMEQTVAVMDVAFIGLLYHRHIPFIDEDTDELVRPDIAPADYTVTLSILSNALIEQTGMDPTTIIETTMDAANYVLPHLRHPDSLDKDGTLLHVQFLALSMIGMLVHRHVPTTHDKPRKE
jgi:hypothetical protein